MNIRTLLGGLAIAALLPALAIAQSFPESGRTITMIVASSAGGGTDIAARMIAPIMERELGVPVEVVNRPGANNQVGLTELATAPADGYTVGFTNHPNIATLYLDPNRQAAFGPDSFQPIGMLFSAPYAISVLAESPHQTIADVVAAAKAEPGKLRGGTAGIMSGAHLANLEFQRAAGVELATVNFEGGGPQMTALLGGHIDVGFNSISEVLSHQAAGTIRVLAVMNDARNPLLPDVPTLPEQGIDAEPAGSFIGLSAPSGIPPDVLARLSDAFSAAANDSEVAKSMAESGNTLLYMTPEGYAEFWVEADASIAPLVESAKASAN
jgi:tripartite-type tricarboxylate transporter receptor subunit TctC